MGMVFSRGTDWIKSGEKRCTLSWEVEELGASARGLVEVPHPLFWGMRRLEWEQRRCSSRACGSIAAPVFIVSVLY